MSDQEEEKNKNQYTESQPPSTNAINAAMTTLNTPEPDYYWCWCCSCVGLCLEGGGGNAGACDLSGCCDAGACAGACDGGCTC